MLLKTYLKSFTSQNKSFIQELRFSQAEVGIQNNYEHYGQIAEEKEQEMRQNKIDSFTDDLLNKKYKKIAFLTGAGISVSAGIPDFRSPDIGLYAQIKKEYNITDPMKIFSIRYYRENPIPFIRVIKDFFSREYQPTYAHTLINLLNKRKQLLVNITQNIDGLELKSGLSPSKLVQAHGHMRSAHCINCNHQVNIDIFLQNCKSLLHTNCPKCQNFVKPKIVFFGELLPEEFYMSQDKLEKADCVVVMGTSLGVFPFANLVISTKPTVPIFIINNQLPKNVNNLSNQIHFLQGDINQISKQIYDKLNS